MSADPSPKEALRREIRERLRQDGTQPGSAFLSRLTASALFREAPAIVAYIAIQKELPLGSLLELALSAGKQLFLPRFDGQAYLLAQIGDLAEELRPGRYGIPEPSSGCPAAACLPANALWLIPGMAFDRRGNRLGRGGGYYDRLRQVYPGGIAIGICRDCQIVDAVPVQPWDCPVDMVLTPKHWLSFRNDICSEPSS